MTPAQIKSIADRHLDAWFAADPLTSKVGLRDHVEAAISEALAEQYAENCRNGTAPRDINNPEFVRHCGPSGAPDV